MPSSDEIWHSIALSGMAAIRMRAELRRLPVNDDGGRYGLTALRMTLAGQPATKKNSQRVIKIKRKGGKGFTKLLPSEAYEKYEAGCLQSISDDMKLRIDRPVNVQCVYYMKTRRAVDLSNLLEASHDILVKAGVLSDDNRNIIASVDGSRVLYDRQNPRVEITITDAEESYTQWDTKAKKRRE